MSDTVIEFQSVSRRFGSQEALKDVSFSIQRGLVYGLVGVNGAGKTTIIKHVLGLLRAQTGTVRVLGLDPVRDAVEVLRRIGYLSERRELPEWMRIGELMWYTRAYYPQWDDAYCRKLLQTFHLCPKKRVRELSQGMRAQVALIAAVCTRPDLLLLDEPSSGLDPIVRRDILDAIVRTVVESGHTVLFSSHLLDEVEELSNHILMIDRGQLVLQGAMPQIRERHSVLQLRFASASGQLPVFEGIVASESAGGVWTVIAEGDVEKLRRAAQACGATVLRTRRATLEEIFVGRASRAGSWDAT